MNSVMISCQYDRIVEASYINVNHKRNSSNFKQDLTSTCDVS